MKKILFLAGMGFVASMFLQIDTYALYKKAKVTLIVVDEEGKPLEGVDAGVGFEKNTGWSTDTKAQRGLTDTEGRFIASGNCNGHIGYGGRKEGYYRSHYEYDFKELGSFGWEPWNPELRVVMRKIENPVPMYARNTKIAKKGIAIPEIGKEVGFDLIAYDWVVPYGSGQVSDLIFFLERRFSKMNNYGAELTISFSSKYDGIIKINDNLNIGSQLKLPRYAPEEGYNSRIKLRTSQNPSGDWVRGYRATDNYIFRIRSVIEDGKLIKAIYGKILGPIHFEPRIDPTEVYFKYYLNPDYTRNLEFDPDRNLFGPLPPLEQVGIK